jgi:hypothetical protein
MLGLAGVPAIAGGAMALGLLAGPVTVGPIVPPELVPPDGPVCPVAILAPANRKAAESIAI